MSVLYRYFLFHWSIHMNYSAHTFITYIPNNIIVILVIVIVNMKIMYKYSLNTQFTNCSKVNVTRRVFI